MAGEAENAVAPAVATETPYKMTIKGGVPSSNANEEFIRVDWSRAAKYGQLDRRTGFVSVIKDHSAEFIQAVKEGKLQLKMGAKTRNGNYLINVIDPEVDSVEVNEEELIEHSA